MNDVPNGSCMCGTVQFSFKGKPRFVGECVCASCRRAHGASVVAWVGVKAEQFTLNSGHSTLKWYHSSQPSERGFCQQCGTRMLFRSTKWPGEIHMALACIDEPHNFVCNGLGFKEELPSWSAVKF